MRQGACSLGGYVEAVRVRDQEPRDSPEVLHWPHLRGVATRLRAQCRSLLSHRRPRAMVPRNRVRRRMSRCRLRAVPEVRVRCCVRPAASEIAFGSSLIRTRPCHDVDVCGPSKRLQPPHCPRCYRLGGPSQAIVFLHPTMLAQVPINNGISAEVARVMRTG
jgi:hypothetical protein